MEEVLFCDLCQVCWAGVYNVPGKCPYGIYEVAEAKRLGFERKVETMSQKRTVMYKCDRCGAAAYFEQNVPGAGAKWGSVSPDGKTNIDLCPDCMEEYKELTGAFFNTEE